MRIHRSTHHPIRSNLELRRTRCLDYSYYIYRAKQTKLFMDYKTLGSRFTVSLNGSRVEMFVHEIILILTSGLSILLIYYYPTMTDTTSSDDIQLELKQPVSDSLNSQTVSDPDHHSPQPSVPDADTIYLFIPRCVHTEIDDEFNTNKQHSSLFRCCIKPKPIATRYQIDPTQLMEYCIMSIVHSINY